MTEGGGEKIRLAPGESLLPREKKTYHHHPRPVDRAKEAFSKQEKENTERRSYRNEEIRP